MLQFIVAIFYANDFQLFMGKCLHHSKRGYKTKWSLTKWQEEEEKPCWWLWW